MRLRDIYTLPTAPAVAQDVVQGVAPTRDTSPQMGEAPHAVAISWIGLVIAIILLRVIYEVSD